MFLQVREILSEIKNVEVIAKGSSVKNSKKEKSLKNYMDVVIGKK